jgi:hypothetical protein
METASGTWAVGLPGEQQDTAQRETENGNVTRQLKVRNDTKRHSDREGVAQWEQTMLEPSINYIRWLKEGLTPNRDKRSTTIVREYDSPATGAHPDSSKPVTKGRNDGIKIGDKCRNPNTDVQ